TCLKALANEPVWKPGQTHAAGGCLGDRVEVVQPQPVDGRNLHRSFALSREQPWANAARSTIDDGMVLAEVLRLLRPAVHLDIGRRSADDHALARNTPRNHSGFVVQLAGADGKIIAVLRKIGDAVAEGYVKLQSGIFLRQRQ